MISKRVKSFESKEVRRIFELASRIKNPIDLSIGEPNFDIPEEIKEEAIRHIRKGFNKYTHSSGLEELREELVKKIKSKNRINVNKNQISLTPGISGGLLVTSLTLFDRDDEVIVLDPYFPTFPELVKLSEAKPVYVDTYPSFSLPLEKIEEAITKKTKAIIVNSPNNPTGAVYPESDLRNLVRIAKEHNLVIISDEIYEDYVYEGKHFSVGSIYENTVSLWGFSKTYGMTGWRLGYLTGPEKFMEKIHDLVQYLYFSPPSIPQKAAVKALKIGPPREVLSEFKDKRNFVLEHLSDNYKVAGAQGSYYVFFEVPGGDADKYLEQVMKKKLFVFPGKIFSQRNTHVRISFSADLTVLKKAVNIMNNVV